MSDWIITAVLLIGALVTFRKAWGFMYDDFSTSFSTPIDKSDYVMFTFCAMVCALGWPLVAVGYLAYRFLTPQTAARRADAAMARKAELERLEREIASQERALGIGRDTRPPSA